MQIFDIESLGYNCVFDSGNLFIEKSNADEKLFNEQICETFTCSGSTDEFSLDLMLPMRAKIDCKETIRIRIYYCQEENIMTQTMLPLCKPLDSCYAYWPNATLAMFKQENKAYNFWVASDDYSLLVNNVQDSKMVSKLAFLRKSKPRLHVVIHKF
jgi:hypothetical protein